MYDFKIKHLKKHKWKKKLLIKRINVIKEKGWRNGTVKKIWTAELNVPRLVLGLNVSGLMVLGFVIKGFLVLESLY